MKTGSRMIVAVIVVVATLGVGIVARIAAPSHVTAGRIGDPNPTAVTETQGSPVARESDVIPADTYPPGITAIRPSRPGESLASGQPAVSTEDVRAFLSSTPPSYWDRTSPPPIITSIEFMSAAEASKRFADSLLRPPDTVLCVVTLTGRFIVAAPPTDKVDRFSMVGTSSVLIFDANTGNWLMESVQ